MAKNAFSKWLNLFIEEKGIDPDYFIEVIDREGTPNLMTVEVIIEALHNAPASEQNAIKTAFVKIDFMNGNVYRYFEHLGKCMANVRLDRMQAA